MERYFWWLCLKNTCVLVINNESKHNIQVHVYPRFHMYSIMGTDTNTGSWHRYSLTCVICRATHWFSNMWSYMRHRCTSGEPWLEHVSERPGAGENLHSDQLGHTHNLLFSIVLRLSLHPTYSTCIGHTMRKSCTHRPLKQPARLSVKENDITASQ